jgi:hypothetical protein
MVHYQFRQHLEKLSEAVRHDATRMAGMPDVTNSASIDVLVKQFKDKQDATKEELKRTYDICRKRAGHEAWADIKIISDISTLQRERGKVGLREEYPKLVAAHPDSERLAQSYFEFLLNDDKFSDATSFAEVFRSKHPDSLPFQVIKKYTPKLSESISLSRPSKLPRER